MKNVKKGFYHQDEYAEVRDFMKRKILEISNENPNAVFGFYVDDLRARLSYDWFIDQGIEFSRVRVTLLADGVGTYNMFFNLFNKDSKGKDNWEKAKKEILKLNWINKKVNSRPYISWERESYTWPYYLSTFPHCNYQLHNASLIETKDKYLAKEISKMNVINKNPVQFLEKFSDNKKELFFKMLKFDMNALKQKFKSNAKKNLIIVGGYLSVDSRPYIQRVYDKYNENYNIFYSIHPGDKDWEDYEERYPGLKFLPFQMPLELLFWTMPEKIHIVGGSQSSSFITIPPEKVKFMFATDSDTMVRPLNIIFENYKNKIEWMA